MDEIDLPDAEMDVMACIWRGIGTAAAIRKSLAKRRPMAHASVCTLLKRLEDKQLVSRRKSLVGKAFVYEARIKPVGASRSMMRKMLDRLFSGSGVALVASLLETHPPTDSELGELEDLLKELRSNRDGPSKAAERSLRNDSQSATRNSSIKRSKVQ